MQSFLEETLAYINSRYTNLESLTIILPSKRAGSFLKQHLRNTSIKTSFGPNILSIEEFIENVSGLSIISNTELLYRTYDAYLKLNTGKTSEDFESFSNWATTLLSDFNEIDRYLIDSNKFFSYLKDIKDIEHWYLHSEKTTLIADYVIFWESLFPLYRTLNDSLFNLDLGYQGMVYRAAAKNIEHYIAANTKKKHLFIGFNALNNAEQTIIQELLEYGNSEVLWDIDSHFLNDNTHAASHFVRNYLNGWKYFKSNKTKHISTNYTNEKNIEFIEVSKNIGQAKYIGELLSTFSKEDLKDTAIVLADEALLIPVLNSLPPNVLKANVTMGASLKSFPPTDFFDRLLHLHKNYNSSFYYKDILAVLDHPIGRILISNARVIKDQFIVDNNTHISYDVLFEKSTETSKPNIQLLFDNWNNDAKTALHRCKKIIQVIKETKTTSEITNVVLYKLFNIFEEMLSLENKFGHLTKIRQISKMYQELIASATLDFEGDAFNGLQIMGVLETRVLDFKNIIIASVNEGVLPAGKSNSSFITYDLKFQYGLPQFTDKDAIYTYHFYHMLQRAENIHILYSNFSEGINSGEKSRFILQMEIDSIENHKVKKTVLIPKINLGTKMPEVIIKTPAIMEKLREIASRGFSPSALTSYIRNPTDFYLQRIIGIRDTIEVEETVAANTIGTIIHDSLETLYKPFLNTELSIEGLKDAKKIIIEIVTLQFQKTFKAGNIKTGKNLIIFEVAKRYIENFIDFEIKDIGLGNSIKLLHLEQNLETNLQIEGLDYPVKLKGLVDRVDKYNGQLRIIDYKTGSVSQGELEIMEWEELTSDYKYSKIVQILAYAAMLSDTKIQFPIQAGIISFKNLANGYLPFATKKTARGTKDQQITQEVLAEYMVELKKLIVEICNPEIPFTEKIIQ